MFLTNARVLSIAAPSDMSDDVFAADAPVSQWAGDAAAYYHSGVKRVFTGSSITNLDESWLLVPVAVALAGDTGSLVTFTDATGSSTRTIASIEIFSGARTQVIDQARMWLEDDDS